MEDLKPVPGERLWGDTPEGYERGIAGVTDPELLAAADSFYNRGFAQLKGAVSHEQIDEVAKAYAEWCEENKDKNQSTRTDGRLPRVVNLHSARDELKALYASNKNVLKVVDFLFGYKSSVYTSLTFQFGTEQPLHRDTPVFRTEPEEFYFGVWFALEDATEENGCLTALEGGHKQEWVDPYEFAEANLESWDELKAYGPPLWSPYQREITITAKAAGCEQIMIPAEKGDVIIWHPQLPHGGSKVNNPEKTRLSAVFHVVPERVPVYQADVFFNRNSEPSRVPSFKYSEFDGVEFVRNGALFGKN